MISAGKAGQNRYKQEQAKIMLAAAKQLHASFSNIEKDYGMFSTIADAEQSAVVREYVVSLMVTLAERYGCAAGANAMELAEVVGEAAKGKYKAGQVTWKPNEESLRASVQYAMGSLFSGDSDDPYALPEDGIANFETRLMDVLMRNVGEASTASVKENAHGRKVRYRRIASDNCCEVCQNLADLGWVSDEESVSFQHDGCTCVIECGYEE